LRWHWRFSHCEAEGIANGDFEAGLGCWQSGGNLGLRVVDDPNVAHRGRRALLLGDPTAACRQPPVGEAWIEQELNVPPIGSPRLLLWYDLWTHDKNANLSEQFDHVDVLLDEERILRLANTSLPYSCDTPPNHLGWQRFEYDLSSHRGQHMLLRVLLSTPDGYYNTWVYVDDVAVTW